MKVCSPLGVVENRQLKKRLYLDGQYINVFDQYEAFTYEKLSQVPEYLTGEDCIMLTDLKSGYHQLKMHPETFPNLCIEFGGKVYYFTHLPFGLSSACRVYTVLMSEVYRPFRVYGQRMTSLIDNINALFAFPRGGTANHDHRAVTILQIMSSLGVFLSTAKCQFLPAPQGKFLGLVVNVTETRFEIPQDEVDYILGVIKGALDAPAVTQRQLAQIAGLLVSVEPAVYIVC